jgi:hypothetical protein
MSDPVSELKRELLAAAERQQEHVFPARKRGGRWLSPFHVEQAPRRRRLVMFAAAALVAVVGTAAAVGSVRDFIVDRGFIGLPPEGATPSAPDSGELVVQWMGLAAPISPQRDGRDIVGAWVYADGRIIWDRRPWHGKGAIPEGANEFTSGYLEQRLAPEGVDLVRAAVAELIDRSRSLVEEIPAEDDAWWGSHHPRLALFVPKDFGSGWGVVAVPDGDRSDRLLWSGETSGSVFEGTFATAEQLLSLRRVHALLSDPASVLPSSAWSVRKVRAYVPSHYAVCIDTSPPKDASELLSLLPARAAELLRDKSRTQSAGGTTEIYDGTVVETPGVTDCYKVETEDAREVSDALSGLVREQGWGTHWLRWRVDEAADGKPDEWNPTDITIEPYFPDGRIPFSGPSG